MQVQSFRIQNFRSIVDSGFIKLSPDGITVFVGQNESGKSSVLDGLFHALNGTKLSDDDMRIQSDPPRMSLRLSGCELATVAEDLKDYEGYSEDLLEPIGKFLQEADGNLELAVTWKMKPGAKASEAIVESVGADRLDEMLKQRRSLLGTRPVVEKTQELEGATSTVETSDDLAATTAQNSNGSAVPFIADDLHDAFWRNLPTAVRFTEEDGSLPERVDIDEKGQPTGAGAKAAQNFLRIGRVDLPRVIKGDLRFRTYSMDSANKRVSEDFNSFWSQVIGENGRLSLRCEIETYDASAPADKVGKSHLVFWISDGRNLLYPKQRSRGTRWFISFYLQLKASELGSAQRFFLLDEPGANLHARAQEDVLKLINQLSKQKSQVVYSTHSPQLVEYEKLYRVHAVQRTAGGEDSPSTVIDAHRLGTASRDTLSPLMSAMGADFTQNNVISRTNNVLIEEMSAFYYLKTFWELTGQPKPAHFIAATGVNNIEPLANMFIGWGLDFIVGVDDDKQGREAYNTMKRFLFGDDENIANRRLLKWPGCPSIEELLSAKDFANYVVGDPTVQISGNNSEYLKERSLSKPILAYQFRLRVKSQALTFEMFDDETRGRVNLVLQAIAERLA